jgi:hypothetical protein
MVSDVFAPGLMRMVVSSLTARARIFTCCGLYRAELSGLPQ